MRVRGKPRGGKGRGETCEERGRKKSKRNGEWNWNSRDKPEGEVMGGGEGGIRYQND